MRKMWQEFREFAFKGNVIDMAVGVMIGAAFGKIVTSLVNDLFMPLLSVLTGRVNMSDLSVTLGEGEAAPVLQYGAFSQSVLDFILIALCIFFFLKLITKLRRQLEHKEKAEAQAAPEPRLCPYCKAEVHPEATRCPHCTSHLLGSAAPDTPA